jgi:hypothetical protein
MAEWCTRMTRNGREEEDYKDSTPEVLMTVTTCMKNSSFVELAPCTPANVYQYFGRTYRLHRQGRISFYPEDRGSTFPRKVNFYYTTRHDIPEESILNGSSPKDSILNGSSPEDSIFNGSSPKDSILNGRSPEDSIFNGRSPEESILKDSITYTSHELNPGRPTRSSSLKWLKCHRSSWKVYKCRMKTGQLCDSLQRPARDRT